MLAQRLSDVPECARELLVRGFVHLRERHPGKAAAWARARAIFAAAAERDALGRDMPPLAVVGEFALPPDDVQPRPFQTLHVDFGLPITAREPVDIARYTALHVAAGQPETTAFTRIVPLAPLLAQRAWSDRSTLVGRLRRYATSGRGDHVEGILARLVEAADDCADLPSTAAPGFLCGMEFESIEEERAHFSKRRLDLARAEHRIRLAPGELLVFDNLATAHGRVGARRPNELHQLCVGYPGLQPGRQRTLLLRVLDAFG